MVCILLAQEIALPQGGLKAFGILAAEIGAVLAVDYYPSAARHEADDIVAGHGVAAVREAHQKSAHSLNLYRAGGLSDFVVGQNLCGLGNFLFIVVYKFADYLVYADRAVSDRRHHFVDRREYKLV